MPRILVVDDSLSVRKVVERALASRNIEVLSASSGAEAFEVMERESPDLVVSDVIMADRDGYQICEWIKSHPRFGHVPVLLISGIVNGAVLERAAKVRADDVLDKPFAAEDLLTKVQKLLEEAPAPAPAPAVAPAPAATPTPVAAASRRQPAPVPESLMDDEPLTQADLKKVLDRFVSMPGVGFAALVDKDGFLIEATGERALQAELAAALASCLAESSTGIGRELGHGALHGMILEYETGILSLHAVGPQTMLIIGIVDPPILGKVRYYVKKALPDLLRVM